ncbi:MAG: 3-dehydroquinate synthase [bacterium ADurb.Bin478]|nr:MAG: 3-dehydroquinate synthase [bacterium ADurb.Bin478]
MKEIRVTLPHLTYPIYCAPSALERLPELVHRHQVHEPFYIIADQQVADLYERRLSDLLQPTGLPLFFFHTPVGESAKTLTIAEELYTWLIQNRADRSSVILALGGGVVGDLAGFVAATFMRGMRLIQIPTTLLAQVDSSVGGKVGINHRLGKNLIGAFHHPLFVLLDPLLLFTLAPRQVAAGLAEVVKYGCISDQELFDWLSDGWSDIVRLKDPQQIEHLLMTCCSIKARVVGNDEKEKEGRAILNFGHTIGHALEAATGFATFLHGEAVAHGMRAAAWLSLHKGLLPHRDFLRVCALCEQLASPPIPDSVTEERLLSLMLHDKKRTRSGQQWVLLSAIGQACLTRQVTLEETSAALHWLLNR